VRASKSDIDFHYYSRIARLFSLPEREQEKQCSHRTRLLKSRFPNANVEVQRTIEKGVIKVTNSENLLNELVDLIGKFKSLAETAKDLDKPEVAQHLDVARIHLVSAAEQMEPPASLWRE